MSTVLVTGGAGYVGAVLVPKLLSAGHTVKVLDWYIFGDVLADVKSNPNLTEIKGDIRDRELVKKTLAGCDAVIHLACISNDPSYELDPNLGKSINYDATVMIMDEAVAAGIKRFIYASSSSVYGVKEEEKVTEELSLEPLTDYSKFKALGEEYLATKQSADFTTLTLRPATVCGYSPRLRLDLTVNILTAHAYFRGLITVFGGDQARPNIHIDDITDLYVQSLAYPTEKIAGKIYNAGYDNFKVSAIAEMVKEVLHDRKITIETKPSDDKRSYRVDSTKIAQELGFVPKRTVKDAIQDLVDAFTAGKVPDAMTDKRYYNIKTLQAYLKK